MSLNINLDKIDRVLRTFLIGAGSVLITGLLATFAYVVIDHLGLGAFMVLAALVAVYAIGLIVQVATRHIRISN